MALPVISPSALVDFGRYAVGQVVETAATVATIPVRVMGLVGQAELLASRITMIAENADALIERVTRIAADADEAIREAKIIVAAAALTAQNASRLVDEAGAVAAGAARVVIGAEATAEAASAVVVQAASAASEAEQLLDGYSGTLQKAAPLAARFVDELSPEEITAAIKMVDELPRMREHLVNDVMPLLGKLDQVGPDIHQLLEVTQDLHLAIAGLPGLKMLRRRGEERIEEDGGRPS